MWYPETFIRPSISIGQGNVLVSQTHHYWANIKVTSHERYGISIQSKHRSFKILALCEGNPPVIGGFPSQRASNVENAPISCHHNDINQESSMHLKLFLCDLTIPVCMLVQPLLCRYGWWSLAFGVLQGVSLCPVPMALTPIVPPLSELPQDPQQPGLDNH